VHRDRRLAGLRLAGASSAQVRRISALETGLACLLGSALATAGAVVVILSRWQSPAPLAWAGIAVVGVGVPVLGACAGAVALRRVVASPLGWVRRVRPRSGRVSGLLLAGGALLVAAFAAVAVAVTSSGAPRGSRPPYGGLPLTVAGLLVVVGAAAVGLAGGTAALTGRVLARRARTAATLIAAERLREDPWAAARTHAAVLLVTVVGTGFVGVRQAMTARLGRMEHLAADPSFYTTGLDLTAAVGAGPGAAPGDRPAARARAAAGRGRGHGDRRLVRPAHRGRLARHAVRRPPGPPRGVRGLSPGRRGLTAPAAPLGPAGGAQVHVSP
jgi:hypothetical protein